MQQQQVSKKQRAPTQRTFKRRLAESGYSEDAADKIWKWYSVRIQGQRKSSKKQLNE